MQFLRNYIVSLWYYAYVEGYKVDKWKFEKLESWVEFIYQHFSIYLLCKKINNDLR